MSNKYVKMIVTCPGCGEEPDKCPYCGHPIQFILSKKEAKKILADFKKARFRQI